MRARGRSWEQAKDAKVREKDCGAGGGRANEKGGNVQYVMERKTKAGRV